MVEAEVKVKDPQELAANPEFSVFLEASAGTGKTKVLCDRFVRLMLNGADPEKIMCITYTKSAAAEMLNRILSLTRSYADDEDQPKEVNELYHKILLSKYRLKIQTLHSFCLDIITRYKNSKGGAHKTLIDQSVKRKALNEIFTSIANNFLKHKVSDQFILLSSHFPTSTIKSRILDLMYKTTALKKYFNSHLDLKDHVFKLHDAREDFNYELAQEDSFDMYSFDKHGFDKDILINVGRVDKKAIEILQALEHYDYKALVKLLLTLEWTKRKLFTSKKAIAADVRITKFIGDMQESIIDVELQYKNHMFAKLNVAFMEVTKEVLTKYEQYKLENHYIDYDDIILGAYELLKGDPGILYALDYQIDHILVDEAQDLSEIQWSFIEMISNEFFSGMGAREINRTLFIVGDFKQSIFSFQGAEPTIFKSIYHTFSKLSPNTWLKIGMDKSFRSEQNIIKLVNSVFPKLFDDYVDHQHHKLNLGKVEIWPLIEIENKIKRVGWNLPSPNFESDDSNEKLATFISGKIISWLAEGKTIEGYGLIEAKDIMVLVRKRSAAVDMLAAKLKQTGLKVSTPNYGEFSNNLVIMDIISLLKFILCPYDDLNLACLLKSAFFSISEETLFNLAYKRQGTLLNELEHKLPLVLRELMYMRSVFEKLSIFDALYTILSNTKGFHNKFGDSVSKNLDDFLEAAYNYEKFKGGIKGLLDYLDFYHIDTTNQDTQDSIRIMTVHSAKGLQAPIVILADAASSEANLFDDVFFHKNELYFSAGAHQKSSSYSAALDEIKQQDSCESLRLLYVAITRAESELYVAGIQSRLARSNWYDIAKSV